MAQFKGCLDRTLRSDIVLYYISVFVMMMSTPVFADKMQLAEREAVLPVLLFSGQSYACDIFLLYSVHSVNSGYCCFNSSILCFSAP